MRRRKPAAGIIQEGTTNVLHAGTGDVNVQVQASGRRYVLEAFPAPVQVKLQGGPISRLLAADMQVVPFDPRRDPDLNRLGQWRDKPEALHVMLLSGPGGQGKTRLASEFARRCGEAGWVVARARHTIDVKLGTVPVAADPDSRGHLLLVDYAERWPIDDLLSLFNDGFVRHQTAARVLLVARPAGRWWEALRQELFGRAPDPDHLRLSALAPGPLDRRLAFEHARNAFADALGVREAQRIRPPASLDDPAYGLALSLHMAALVAVDAYARGESAPDDPARLTSYLVRREYMHWGRMHRSGQIHATEPQMAGMTLTATLTQPMAWPAAEKLLVAAGLADTPVSAKSLLRDHQACYPASQAGTGNVLEPLYPDRLGEDFVAIHLAGGPSDELDLADGSFDDIPASLLYATADDRPPAYAGNVITMLVETARRWPHVADHYLYPLLRDRPALAFAAGSATLAALAENADIPLLERVERGLPPDRHVDLDLAAAVITRRLTEHRLASTSDPVARARMNATLAWRLFNAGLYNEAVRANVEVVQTYRQLAQASPAEFAPKLARALYDLSVLLSALNRSEASTFAWEAVTIYLSLAETGPAGFEAELASALYFLSLLLSERWRGEDAVNVAEYAVQVYERLTGSGRAGLEPDFARTLCSLSRLLSGLGRLEEALAAAQEAVRIYQTVIEATPATFEEDLARALRDTAAILELLGQQEQALNAAEQAVPLYRRLAEANPATLGLGLGEALYQWSALLWEVGQKNKAVAVMEETVQVLQTAADAGHVSRHLVWTGYSTLAVLLEELGHQEEALAIREQAGKTVVQNDPYVYRRDLAEDDVLDIATQAVQANRGLAANDPKFKPDLPPALRELSGILTQLGRPQEALAATQEAVQACRELAADNPADFASHLATRLIDLSGILTQVGRPQEALAAAQEAVQACRHLTANNPHLIIPALVDADRALLVALSMLGQQDEALAASKEAAQVYRTVAATNPALLAPYRATALSDISGIVWELGQREEALALAQEALESYRALAAANPGVFGPNLAQRLRALSGMLSDLGQQEEALVAMQEAVQAYRDLAAANPDVFGPELVGPLSDPQAGLPDAGREEPFIVAERIFQDAVPLARQNGLTFIVALHDRDDATGLARLLTDVRLPEAEAKTVFVAPPVRGLEFFATGTSPADWRDENVLPDSAVIYILDHEPGLSHRLQGIQGTFYVGVPDLSSSHEYNDSSRVLLAKNPLDFAAVIMRDYSHPGSLYGTVFDEGEALRMQYLIGDFPVDPVDLEESFGDSRGISVPRSRESGLFSFELTIESQQRARSAYRPPEQSVPPGAGLHSRARVAADACS